MAALQWQVLWSYYYRVKANVGAISKDEVPDRVDKFVN